MIQPQQSDAKNTSPSTSFFVRTEEEPFIADFHGAHGEDLAEIIELYRQLSTDASPCGLVVSMAPNLEENKKPEQIGHTPAVGSFAVDATAERNGSPDMMKHHPKVQKDERDDHFKTTEMFSTSSIAKFSFPQGDNNDILYDLGNDFLNHAWLVTKEGGRSNDSGDGDDSDDDSVSTFGNDSLKYMRRRQRNRRNKRRTAV